MNAITNISHVVLSAILIAPPVLAQRNKSEWDRVETIKVWDIGNSSRLKFLTSTLGWMSSSADLLRTKDAGRTWSTVPLPSLPLIITRWEVQSTGRLWVQYIPKELPFNTLLVISKDYGAHWQEIGEELGAASGVCFLTGSSLGWAVGSTGDIFKTQDSGNSWRKTGAIPDHISAKHSSIQFVDSMRGVVSFDESVYTTTDSGAHWKESEFPHSCVVKSFFSSYDRSPPVITLDKSLSILKFQNGFMFASRDAGGSWCSIGTDTSPWVHGKPLLPMYPFAILDAQRVWMIGEDGQMYFSVDGGSTWKGYPVAGQLESFSAISCAADSCWAISDQRLVHWPAR